MKKILFSLLTLAAALTVASCQKEPANPDPIYGGKTVETAFTVDLDELPTKAYADGKTADKLLVLVYGADGLVASQSKISPDDAIPISNLKANVTVKFVKGQTYDIVFWAQAEDAPFTLDAATGKLTVANSGPANDENRDAFWYVEKGYVATANDKETVTLKRPFAQINVLLAEEFDAGTKSKMTVENMPNVIDLRSENGDVSGSVTYTFTEAELDDATFDKKYVSGKNYAYGGMNYILVQKGENPVSAAVSFTVTCTNDDLGTIEIEKSLTGVPVKRNYRTNITYSPSASRDYTVIVNPAWDGTNDDISADAEANEFTVQVGGNEFANNATLTMAPNETVNVTIADANGKAPGSAVSTDPEVVKVEAAQGGGYELAALKKGSADINFHIDPYTKQDVQGADFTIKVNVPGDPVLESITVDTKNATTTFALNGTFSSEGVVVTATYDEGDPKDVTADATFSTPDMTTSGEKTVTVSYAEGGVTKETTYTITVEGDTPPVVATLTGITVDASGATTTFTVGDTFSSEGIKVTATYSDESTKDVTEKATVPTAPDMNTAGEKTVTVSYTEGEGDSANTKTATYTITVNDGDTPVEDPMAATKTETLPYEESLTGGQGDFKIYDAVKPEGLTAVWTQNSSNGMVAKAYANNTNYATESWLYTEDIDLGNATAPTLTFSHCARYLGAIEDVSLWIRESEGEWQSLAFSANVENGSSWKWVDNEIDLTAFKGKKIQIAFKYTSSDTAAGTYEVKNFKVEDASGPIETTISFAKESLTLTVGSSATNAVTTNSTGAKTFTSSNESVAEVDETGKVTAKAAGSATITVSIAADGRYTAASDSYPVTVNAASGDTAPVGTVLWEETWAGATNGQLLDAYEFGGTTVFGGKTVSYSYVGGTKIQKDNQMDGSTEQENLMLGKKANDVSGTWGISGIPTGKASKAILTIYTNNATTFKSDLITLTSSTSGVTIKDKKQGAETAKPFSFTFEIEFGTVTTFDLLFTNGYSQNVRIDDITLTVAD